MGTQLYTYPNIDLTMLQITWCYAYMSLPWILTITMFGTVGELMSGILNVEKIILSAAIEPTDIV